MWSKVDVSWSISSLFAILHFDLWMIGYHTDSNSNMALMDAMCDISMLIVVFLVSDESSTTLASHFTQYMLI